MLMTTLLKQGALTKNQIFLEFTQHVRYSQMKWCYLDGLMAKSELLELTTTNNYGRLIMHIKMV